MQIVKNKISGYNYAFISEFKPDIYEYLKFMKDKYGFRKFTFFDRAWRFTDIETAVEIKDRYPEVEIASDIKTEFDLATFLVKESVLTKINADRLKKSKETNLTIKGIKGELYPYQRVGVEFFLNSGGRAINADPMGSGKSLQALAYAAHEDIKKTLVICPAAVKYNWKNEVKKWTNFKSIVIDGNSIVEELMRDFSKYQVYIINYDMLKKYFVFLDNAKFDLLILDEFHYIKNNGAIRTKLAKRLGRNITKTILLSGTPFLSRPAELFNGLNLIDPKTWFDYYSYGRRYCNGHMGRFGWDDKGATNIGELQERISPYFIRRTKKEILPDLPEKKFINHPVELDEVTRKKYKMAEEEFGRFLVSVKNKTQVEAARSLQAEKLVKLGALRQLTSMGKINVSAELIEDIVDNGEKMVVFSSYNEPLEQLYEKFKDKALLITGKTDAKERDDLVNRFQTDDSIRIMFGGIKSAGVGINLTKATTALFIDYSWTPADHAQAIDRIHRIGSTSDYITIYQLYSKKTVDEYMYKLLERKQVLFDQLIDGKEVPESVGKSYTSSIIKTIENKQYKKLLTD
jgi:SWI/SNF-related matrix-associated actin-dependent regulator of chromatin subfamily A-like protein 1